MALHASQTIKSTPDVLYLGLAGGLSLFLITMIVGKISGVLINLAVTLGLATSGRFPRAEIAPYLIAQFAAAQLYRVLAAQPAAKPAPEGDHAG